MNFGFWLQVFGCIVIIPLEYRSCGSLVASGRTRDCQLAHNLSKDSSEIRRTCRNRQSLCSRDRLGKERWVSGFASVSRGSQALDMRREKLARFPILNWRLSSRVRLRRLFSCTPQLGFLHPLAVLSSAPHRLAHRRQDPSTSSSLLRISCALGEACRNRFRATEQVGREMRRRQVAAGNGETLFGNAGLAGSAERGESSNTLTVWKVGSLLRSSFARSIC